MQLQLLAAVTKAPHKHTPVVKKPPRASTGARCRWGCSSRPAPPPAPPRPAHRRAPETPVTQATSPAADDGRRASPTHPHPRWGAAPGRRKPAAAARTQQQWAPSSTTQRDGRSGSGRQVYRDNSTTGAGSGGGGSGKRAEGKGEERERKRERVTAQVMGMAAARPRGGGNAGGVVKGGLPRCTLAPRGNGRSSVGGRGLPAWAGCGRGGGRQTDSCAGATRGHVGDASVDNGQIV